MLNYSIIEGADKMDLDQVMALLKETYWAADRSADQVRKSIEHSCCYGIQQRFVQWYFVQKRAWLCLPCRI